MKTLGYDVVTNLVEEMMETCGLSATDTLHELEQELLNEELLEQTYLEIAKERNVQAGDNFETLRENLLSDLWSDLLLIEILSTIEKDKAKKFLKEKAKEVGYQI